MKRAYGKEIDEKQIEKTQELSGLGIEAIIDNKCVLVGNEKLMKEKNIKYSKSNDIGTILYVAVNGEFKGYILIADEIKKEAKKQ